jgi:hypothetical protein
MWEVGTTKKRQVQIYLPRRAEDFTRSRCRTFAADRTSAVNRGFLGFLAAALDEGVVGAVL